MRLLMAAMLVTGACAFAQQPSATGFGRVINPSGITPAPGGAGFGRMIYPGTGGPPATIRPGTSGVNGGRGPGRGRVNAPPAVQHNGHSGAVIVPYPVYYGGAYYPYDAPPAPTQSYEYDQGYAGDYSSQQPSPVVIINQNFRPDTVNPVIRDYTNTPLPQYIPPPQAPAQPTVATGDGMPPLYFLIAMKDGTIYPAVAYWMEGDTLNYMTTQGVRNRVSLELVNRDFSRQLNKERNVDFGLPEPPAPAK